MVDHYNSTSMIAKKQHKNVGSGNWPLSINFFENIAEHQK
jgi:hypothetical protein